VFAFAGNRGQTKRQGQFLVELAHFGRQSETKPQKNERNISNIITKTFWKKVTFESCQSTICYSATLLAGLLTKGQIYCLIA
jgi:hypothetical protein